jgi:uncharacterized protein YecT (DUF1311 family)
MIAALLLLAAAVPTAEEDCGDLPQQSMNLCVYRNFERVDAAMNAQWKITAAAMKVADAALDRTYDRDPGYFDTLLAAQRAWLTYREQHCLSASFEARGGSMSPMLDSGCKLRLTKERMKQLKDLVEFGNR